MAKIKIDCEKEESNEKLWEKILQNNIAKHKTKFTVNHRTLLRRLNEKCSRDHLLIRQTFLSESKQQRKKRKRNFFHETNFSSHLVDQKAVERLMCVGLKLDDKLKRIYLQSRGEVERVVVAVKGMKWNFNLIKTKIKVVLIVNKAGWMNEWMFSKTYKIILIDFWLHFSSVFNDTFFPWSLGHLMRD